MIFRVGMVFVDNEQLKSRPASTTKVDPTDPMIFRVGMVFVDNEQLKSRPASTTKVVGGTARHSPMTCPAGSVRPSATQLNSKSSSRKFVGRETRLRIQAQLFRSVTDAEYRLSVDSGLKVTRLWPSAAEVSAIGVARGGSIEATYAAPFDKNAAIVHLPFPLQPGSTIAFLVDRDPTIQDG